MSEIKQCEKCKGTYSDNSRFVSVSYSQNSRLFFNKPVSSTSDIEETEIELLNDEGNSVITVSIRNRLISSKEIIEEIRELLKKYKKKVKYHDEICHAK